MAHRSNGREKPHSSPRLRRSGGCSARVRCACPRRSDAARPARPGQRRVGRDAAHLRVEPGADSYQFQVAADQNFNSPVLGQGEGSFTTKNTRATLKKTLPNGRYWWRVRATSRTGDTSPWSGGRSVVKSWTEVPASQSPFSGYPFLFPTDPMTLTWSPVPYAASYLFS